MIPYCTHLPEMVRLLPRSPSAAVLGARHGGKTALARAVVSRCKPRIRLHAVASSQCGLYNERQPNSTVASKGGLGLAYRSHWIGRQSELAWEVRREDPYAC